MMHTVYGIPNCNTVKKSLDWLNKHSIPYQFHNYKKEGITTATLNNWCKQVNWQELINRKGTTWRSLDTSQQSTITNQKNAVKLMTEFTSVIKRPVIELNGKIIIIGFDETEYSKTFLQK